MKRQWSPEELIENFILVPKEQAILPGDVANANVHNRLGFAVMLKFFQLEGRFPNHLGEIPHLVIEFMAQQLGFEETDLSRYSLSGSIHKRHRVQIREFLGFRRINKEDKVAVKQWLVDAVLPQAPHLETLKEQLNEYLRHLQLERPSPQEVNRLIHSATRSHEQLFCRSIANRIPPTARLKMDALLSTETTLDDEAQFRQSEFNRLKSDPGRLGLKSLLREVGKLASIRQLELPADLFKDVSSKLLKAYRRRASADLAGRLRRHPAPIRYTLIAAFCYQRLQEITDNLVELLVQIVHRLSINAERRVEREFLEDFKRVHGKEAILYRIAQATLAHPDQAVKEVIYPIASPTKLQALIQERESSGATYREKVYTRIRASYLHHYRRMVPPLLAALEFKSNNETHRPAIQALALLKRYQDNPNRYFDANEKAIMTGVLTGGQQNLVVEKDTEGKERINRVNYEICVLQALREKLRSREVWVEGAKQFGNPEQDLPTDFEQQRVEYYQALHQPMDVDAFIKTLQGRMSNALVTLDQELPDNEQVKILQRNKGWIAVSPLTAQPDPPNLSDLKQELTRRWSLTSLLEVLKETDLRVNFTDRFRTVASREHLERSTLQRRLLLALYGLGTNTGLKRICAGVPEESHANLLYVKRNFIHTEHLRNAITQVVNAIFQVRSASIWGEATTTCASDSKKFGAWDQNLMTEWHSRYGGRGVMIYWHVEKKSACIYSQLKTCSSSEAAAMLTGLLRHKTTMTVERNYVDTHGQNEVVFAFCHLLGFELMPRFKRIGAQRLYQPYTGAREDYPNLKQVLTRAIDWEVIRQQYDQIIKYATALRLGTAATESILKIFSRSEIQHPTHRALVELGRAVKTIFLCRYLRSEALRQEINEGLNVVERWNGANDFIFYGRGGEFATNRITNQEISALALHLLQSCLIYINTLMIQQILSEPEWMSKMQAEDFRALTPLIWNHITPYGSFRLNFEERLHLDITQEI